MATVVMQVPDEAVGVLAQIAEENGTTAQELLGQCLKFGVIYALSEQRHTVFRTTGPDGGVMLFSLFAKDSKGGRSPIVDLQQHIAPTTI